MEIVKAKLTDIERLAELNRCLIEDEQHPNPMNIAELTERMKEWLTTGYICYLVKENGHIIAYCLIVYTEMMADTIICGSCTWTERIDEKASLRSCLIGCMRTYGRIRKSGWMYSLTTKMLSPFTRDTALESVSIEWKNKKCEGTNDEI